MELRRKLIQSCPQSNKMNFKNRIFYFIIASILLVVLYTGCDLTSDPDPVPKPKPTVKPEVKAPEFNSDSAYAWVQKQVDFGPRIPNTPAHAACAEWMVSKLKSYGAMVTVQEAKLTAYNGKTLQSKNIIASFSPEKKDRILLCSHWDTRPFADKDPDAAMRQKPFSGANDGGSGIGILLEMARHFQSVAPAIGVDIIFFDSEDNGTPEFVTEEEVKHEDFETSWCLGSQYWAKHKVPANYQARFGILLDMVGHGKAEFNKEMASMQWGEDVVNLVWNTAAKLGYGDFFRDKEVSGVTDDHVFVTKGGIRTIDIIDTRPIPAAMGLGNYNFGSYHHTHLDDMTAIDTKTLKAVGQTLLQVVYNL
jgi:hypothetical protein